jgi:hypothetical protein
MPSSVLTAEICSRERKKKHTHMHTHTSAFNDSSFFVDLREAQKESEKENE